MPSFSTHFIYLADFKVVSNSHIFGRPLVKRFALYYRTVVCLMSVCLSVTFVICGQTVGRIKMKLGTQIGLGPGHIVLDGDHPPKGRSLPQFSAHICCGQMAAWIKMPLGMQLGLSPGDLCVRWGPSPPPKFSAHVYYSYCEFVRTLHIVIGLFKFKFKF